MLSDFVIPSGMRFGEDNHLGMSVIFAANVETMYPLTSLFVGLSANICLPAGAMRLLSERLSKPLHDITLLRFDLALS